MAPLARIYTGFYMLILKELRRVSHFYICCKQRYLNRTRKILHWIGRDYTDGFGLGAEVALNRMGMVPEKEGHPPPLLPAHLL